LYTFGRKRRFSCGYDKSDREFFKIFAAPDGDDQIEVILLTKMRHYILKPMPFFKKMFLIILIPFLVVSCTAPELMNASGLFQASQAQTTSGYVAARADGAPTPTPFLPLPPTPTYLPEFYQTPQPSAPDQSGDGAVSRLPQAEGQINILLLGSDQRVIGGGFRTDTIMLLSINTKKKTASLLSFPRDLFLNIPGWMYQRINTAMFHGGFPLLAETLEYNFGIRPDYYISVGLDAFAQLIDSLGGIDVQVAKTLTDLRGDLGYYTIPAGLNHMDGYTALWYVRSRYSTNDFDRTRRQQEVIQALAAHMISINAFESADEIYEIYSTYVTTNMTWTDIAPLIPLAIIIGDASQIRHYFIGPKEVIPWVTSGGAQVLLPQQDAIMAVIRQMLQ